MRERLEQALEDWREAAGRQPVARRLLPWAQSLLAAAQESATCGLGIQAEALLERAVSRLAAVQALPTGDDSEAKLATVWDASGLPSASTRERQTGVWRRVRALRAARLPFQGEHHPAAMGLAWGPYNQQSAVAEALKGAALVDPLWVDDFLEREKAMRALDALLGLR